MSKAVQKVEIKEQAPAIAEASALISMLERMARDPNVDPARIQQFLKMKQDDEDRVSRRAFMAAFSDLQGELPAVARRGKAHNGKAYARFEDLVEAYRPYLVKHCFALSFRTEQQDGSIKITGVLGHKDGHEERTSIVLPMDKTGNKNDVQAWGSSTSYGKRYVAMTLLGIATEDEDDDGKKAGAGTPITDEQVDRIRSLIVDTNSDIGRFCAHFKVEKIEDLPASSFDRAVSALKKKANSA
jgi:hypothetical protein